MIVGTGCPKENLQGWYVCKSGNKYKPVNGGTKTKTGTDRENLSNLKVGIYEGNYENGSYLPGQMGKRIRVTGKKVLY